MDARQDALNDALARLEGVAFTMEPGFSEHGPMVAEAISSLGRNERVGPWVEAYKARYRHIPAPPPRERIDRDAWQGALGDAARFSDWFAFFREELQEQDWRDTMHVWVPRLIDGYASGLTHGLIRTSHAVRGLPDEGRPSALQRDELARGLAYWAGAYLRPAGNPDRSGDLALDAALEQLPRNPPEAAQRSAAGRLAQVRETMPAGADFAAAVESLRATENAEEALSRHTATFARVLLTHAELPLVPQIQLVHTVTSAAALRTFLPLLPPGFGPRAYRRAWHTSASIVARLAQRPPRETDPEIAGPALSPEELADRAIEHRDDHMIKLTEACLREDRLRPDPVYRALAEAMLGRLPPWSGRGPRPH